MASKGYQLAQAYVAVVPSLKGVGNAITKAFGDTSDKVGKQQGAMLGSGFSAGLAGKIGAISGIAQTVAGKVIGMFSGLTGQIVEASDSAQKFASTLQFAGLDTTTIDRLTKSTQDYADKTIYNLSDIRNTTAQLAANGVKDYDRLAEAAGNLNAVAGGTADTYKSVAMVLTQTAGQGKLTTENWNQLSDAIPGASGKIQQALLEMGAYTGNFRDAMAEGQISAEEFNQAILDLGFQDAAVEAATSASTIEGAMGNLEASAVSLGTAFLDGLKPIITGGMGWLSEGISAAVPVVQSGIQNLVDWFSRLWKALEDNGAVDAFKAAWDAIRDAIDGVVNMVVDWSHLIPPETVADGIKLVADTLNWFIQHGESLIPIIAAVGGAFAAFKGYQALNTGLQALTGTMTAVTGGLTGMKNGLLLIMDLGGPVAAIKQFASQLNIVQTAQSLWTAATKLATAAQGALNMVLSANPIMLVVTAIAALVAALAWFFTQTETGRQLWQQFTDFLGTTVENVKQWFGDAAQWISDKWNALVAWFQSVPGMIKGFFNDIGSWFGAKFNEAGQAIQNAWNAVVSFVQSIPGRIKGFFGDIGSWFSGKFNEVKNGIQSKFNEAVDWVRGIPNRILSALGNLGSLLWNAGSSIINGFLNGLKSAWSGVTGFVSGIGSWIAAHKGPLSYDRRLLIPAGEAIMGGFRKSMMAGWRKVQDDVMGMSLDLAGGFSPSIGMAYTPSPASAGANVTITNYYPQADPWPLRTADESDHSFYE